MTDTPIEVIRTAVIVLGLSTLALAMGIFFLMQVRYSRLLAGEARRLMFSGLIVPPWDAANLEALWAACNREDRVIVEEALASQSQFLEGAELAAFERAVSGGAIYAGLIRTLQFGTNQRTVHAARILGYFHDPRGVEALIHSIHHPDPEVSVTSLLSLGRLRSPAAIRPLIDFLESSRAWVPDITLAACFAACARQCPQELSPLLNSTRDRSRLVGAWALSQVADKTVLGLVLKACHDPHPEVRAKAARGLARVSDPSAVEALIGMTQDASWFVRVRALDALGQLRAPTAEAVTLAALDDDVREVRYRAAFALRRIKGMRSEVMAKVLRELSPRAFQNLISEWERAGFLDTVAQDLCGPDLARREEAEKSLRSLIGAGYSSAIENLVLVHPSIDVRLELLRLLMEGAQGAGRDRLRALANDSRCDRRVAKAISEDATGTAALQPEGGAA